MASALIRGLLSSGVCVASDIRVLGRSRARMEELAGKAGVQVAGDAAEAFGEAEAVILCVKPADVETALRGTGGTIGGKLLISVAAGVGIEKLSGWCPAGTRVVRAMPNTCSLVGAGMTVLAYAAGASEEDKKLARAVFEAVGETAEIPEKLFDAATAVSGSGPAYFFLFTEALADAGVAAGLPRDLAVRLAVETARGAGKMLKESGLTASALREMVTSPAGTTAAALRVFEKQGLRGEVMDAVLAAAARSRELSGS